ncbi:MAG: hypothetical protein NTV05_05140 [Acidobacteria bacterium]|nr:hypothetical protein [Acidobacteriota bacterium]
MSGKPGRSGPPANANAQRSGLYARAQTGLQRRDRRVRRLVAKVLRAMPGLQPSDVPTLRAWCELEVLAAFAFLDLTDKGADGGPRLTTETGTPRRMLDAYRQLRQAQLPYARELGLTPAARKSLGLSDRREVTLESYLEARYASQDATPATIDAHVDHSDERAPRADSASGAGDSVEPENSEQA